MWNFDGPLFSILEFWRGVIQVSRISCGESLFSLEFLVLDRGFLKKVYPDYTPLFAFFLE